MLWTLWRESLFLDLKLERGFSARPFVRIQLFKKLRSGLGGSDRHIGQVNGPLSFQEMHALTAICYVLGPVSDCICLSYHKSGMA